MKNPKSGKIVSKKKYAAGKKAIARMKAMGVAAKPYRRRSSRRTAASALGPRSGTRPAGRPRGLQGAVHRRCRSHAFE